MMAVEILSNKLQELFGNNYLIMPFAHFNTEYTTARQVIENGNVGIIRDYSDEYSKIRRNKVVGIVNLTKPERVNADFYYLTSGFKIDFSVPTNVLKKDAEGVVLEVPEINFFSKYEQILKIILNKTVDFGNGYVGKMVISEPVFTTLEDDGEVKYAIYSVTGTFVLTDKAVFGSDYVIELNVNGDYVELDGVNSYVEMLDTGNNAIVEQNTIKTMQNLAQSGWVCTINIDDIQTDNVARRLLYDIIHDNIEIINQDAEKEALKRKLRVKITNSHGNVHEFNAIVNITFRTSKNGTGSYDISFTDDNKGV